MGSAQRSGLIGFRLRGDLPAEPLLAQTLGQLMAELQQVGRGDTVRPDFRYGVPGLVVPVASR